MSRSVFYVGLLSLCAGLPPIAGAADEDSPHWSLQPVTRPKVPRVLDDGWSRNPVDRFLLSHLEHNRLGPSSPANRRTLIRRASFDLLGLPPTPDSIDAFVADRTPDAWERLVNRLLSSPHYGERWARYWLDVARYADNKGYTFFGEKTYPWAWAYRDYVIDSFNDDLPYNRFLLEQLAADQLPLDGTPRSRAAMGFLTVGGRFMDNLHDMLDDQIDVVTRGLMGLTVTCARCHDHKYDPIPQADYYSLYGVFRSSSQPLLPPVLEQVSDTEDQRKFNAELEKRYRKLRGFIENKHREVVSSARSRAADYLLQAQLTLDQPPTDNFMLLTTADGLNPTVVLRWRVLLETARDTRNPVWLPWQHLASLPRSSFARDAAEVLNSPSTNNGSKPRANPLVLQALRKSPPTSLAEAARRYGQLLNAIEKKWQATLKSARQQNTAPPQRLPDAAEEALRRVFHGPAAPPDVPRTFGWGFLALLPDRPAQAAYKELRKALETWMYNGKGAPPRAMVLHEHETPFSPYVFERGNPHRRGETVARQLPEVLAQGPRQPFQQRSGRLELAHAISSPDNPFTARVLVNRVWLHHFGEGLVRTPGDFGTRGTPPTHPALLDFLASWFVQEAGWSIKSLHRLLMTSAAYRQSSQHRPSAYETDPANRLLWRMQRRRLDFESMRDSHLVLADILDRRIGGRPLPIFSSNDLQPRRSIYGFVDRMNPAPLLRTFDVPNPVASCNQRLETTVAPQALHLMNDVRVHTSAQRVSARTTALAGAGRIRQLYRIILGRRPDQDELDSSERFLRFHKPIDTATWTRLAHALLMCNEAQFID